MRRHRNFENTHHSIGLLGGGWPVPISRYHELRWYSDVIADGGGSFRRLIEIALAMTVWIAPRRPSGTEEPLAFTPAPCTNHSPAAGVPGRAARMR